MKKALIVLFALAISTAYPGAFGKNISAAKAASDIGEGKVVKIKGFSSLYYMGPDGKRYVFPNEKAYFSWYDDFSQVTEVDASELYKFSLAGNVQYRPGAVLVKIQTDPKVYAVSTNGILRWVKNEGLAKKLYGDKWNLLVDDIPDTFFTNYQVGTAIENNSDFDPDEEEDTALTISENHDKEIREKTKNRHEKQLNFCTKSEKQINKLQKRALRQGIKIEGVAEDFLKQCVIGAQQPPENDKDKDRNEDEDENKDNGKKKDHNKKITICHIPPGNPAAKQTITVGIPAAKAHLAHGDTVGACSGGTPNDTIAPVISNVLATSTAPTLATITWNTNELSTSKVIYATQSLSTATTTKTAMNSALVASHLISLSGLATSTQYFFRVESMDANNNTATSTEITFTTINQAPIPDIIPPVISAIIATPHATSTDIAWTTNEPSTSKIIYATQVLNTATSTQSISSSLLLTSHLLTLNGLAPSTPYFFRVESMDSHSNTATSTEQTFTTTL